MNRALNYAHNKGVTLVGALGNNHEDLGAPAHRRLQPGLPAGHRVHRARSTTRPACDLPVEGPHVIGVSSLGPSGKKSDYSNYGTRADLGRRAGWLVP